MNAQGSADQLHQVLAVLAPAKRFKLLLLVLSGLDRSVCQLADAVGLSQSCTTRHLQSLERAGLVKGARDGKRVVFRAAPRGAAAAGVLASLGGQSARAEVIVAPRATPRARPEPRRAAARGAASRAAKPRPEPPIPAAETVVAHGSPESGNNSDPPSPPPRFRQELEDYLL
jgi:DNA-binding transcriptional ArsR family regulator